MAPRFSADPGRYERHLRRKYNNSLFPEVEREISAEQVEAMRARDAEELLQFTEGYHTILQEIADLAQNVESEVVLKLKERLDQLYEQVCGLGGDRTAEKAGLTKLHLAVSQAIAAGAAGDPTAEAQLAEEQRARTIHWQLLETSLVADLLCPDSPITQDDLLPSLLSEDNESFNVAMGMFDVEQQRDLLIQAKVLLEGRENDSNLDSAKARYESLKSLVSAADESIK